MDRKAQLEELDVLQSIFYKDEIQILKNDDKDNEVIFWAHPALPEDYTVKYKESLETEEYSYLKVNYLPPFVLHLKLPQSYPSESLPLFVLSCQWLTKIDISKLCLQLDKIWNEHENMEIIYIWVEFLKNDSLQFLGYEKQLDLTVLYSYYLKFQKQRNKILSNKQKSNEQCYVNLEDKLLLGEVKDSQCSKVEKNLERNSDKQITTNYNQKINTKKFVVRSPVNFNNRYKSNKREVYDRRARLNLSKGMSPLKILINYCEERQNIEFQKNYFTCNICFTEQLGRNCTKFEYCNHVFCKSCVSSYFTVQINNGIVLIKCPEIKCSTDVPPVQVRSLVSPELYAKYDSLLLQSAIDSLYHVEYCPRTFCQYPAARDNEENLVICPNCQYVFCVFCKMAYHGIEPCTMKSEDKKKLTDTYLNSSQEVKLKMELRYGYKNLQRIVNESMTENWIESNCKNCPHCDVSIEKSQGCNKMVCWKCSTYFCWLCSAELDRANPYSHYSNPQSSCANKLFYLTPLDEELDDYNGDDEQWRDWDWI